MGFLAGTRIAAATVGFWTALLLSQPACSSPPFGILGSCDLKCEVGSERYGVAITCETGESREAVSDESRFEYGPAGEVSAVAVTLNRERTYAGSNRTYRIWGTIRNDKAAGTVSYDIRATGGAFGTGERTCKAGNAVAGSRPSARRGAGTSPDLAVDANLDLRVPGGYRPAIEVPECDRARAEGRLSGDVWACFASEKGEYVGQGKLWLLPGEPAALAAVYAFGRVTVKGKDRDGEWEFSFSPPKGAAWRAGLYENTLRDGFHDEQHAGLSVSGHSSACGEETGRLEVLDLAYDAKGDTVSRFAANFEQVCSGKRLRGSIRFAAPSAR